MIRKIAIAAAACVASFNVCAVDGVSVEVGRGDDRTSALRIGIEDRWRKRTMLEEWRLAGYWELAGSVWDNSDESTADVSLTPVFRIERRQYFVEAAIGVHLVTSHISAARTFSTALQFGEHLGAGFYFGQNQRYDLTFRVQHISNGHIRSPNPGINFVLVRLQYSLE